MTSLYAEERVWRCGRCGGAGVAGIYCDRCRRVLLEDGALADLAAKEASKARMTALWETRRVEMLEAIRAGREPAKEGKETV